MKSKIYNVAIPIMLIIMVFCMTCCGVSETNNDGDNINIIGGGEKACYVCDATCILEKEIDFTPCFSLKEKIKDGRFLNEWGEILKNTLGEYKNSVLYGAKGCYLSTKGVCLFNIEEYELSNIIRVFIFSDNGEYAGEIYFFMKNGQLDSNISIYDTEQDIRSDVLETLEKSPTEKFIFLTNGYRNATLNVNNELGKLYGNVRFEISGDCYQALNNETLSISYQEVMDKKEWVWVEFE